jgi:hypothetical protein
MSQTTTEPTAGEIVDFSALVDRTRAELVADTRGTGLIAELRWIAQRVRAESDHMGRFDPGDQAAQHAFIRARAAALLFRDLTAPIVALAPSDVETDPDAEIHLAKRRFVDATFGPTADISLPRMMICCAEEIAAAAGQLGNPAANTYPLVIRILATLDCLAGTMRVLDEWIGLRFNITEKTDAPS